jgi:Domain of unknown function (DUF4189)
VKTCKHFLASALVLVAVTHPALAADGFGALAYSQSRVMYTLALNHPSRAAAEHAALMECQQSAGDCTSPVWVQHGCVSLALGTGRGFGTGWGSTRESSEREAMGVCGSKTSSCQIKRTACTAGK